VAPANILISPDGSPLADDALAHALATFDCRVTVLNVVAPLDSGTSEGGILEPGEDRHEAAMERADRPVEQARERAAEAGRTVESGDQLAGGCGGVDAPGKVVAGLGFSAGALALGAVVDTVHLGVAVLPLVVALREVVDEADLFERRRVAVHHGSAGRNPALAFVQRGRAVPGDREKDGRRRYYDPTPATETLLETLDSIHTDD
jgi:hypothetical protein